MLGCSSAVLISTSRGGYSIPNSSHCFFFNVFTATSIPVNLCTATRTVPKKPYVSWVKWKSETPLPYRAQSLVCELEPVQHCLILDSWTFVREPRPALHGA